MNFTEFKKLLRDNVPEVGRLYSAAYRVHQSETYRETMHSVEKLADASFRLFAEKPKEEQVRILTRIVGLSERVNEALGKEAPLVVALTLLTAIRVHEQLVNGISN